jgi:Flp pilus assembly protein TadD
MKLPTSKTILKTTVAVSACLILAACKTTGSTPAKTADGGPSNASIDAALERAASNASASGQTNQSLGYLEKIYKRNSADPQAAINYAAALREAEYLNQAAMVLAPFANDKKGPPAAKTEYAAIQLALGNGKSAEEYAQKAVIQDPNDYRAFNYLGIALEDQGKHKEAERSFRKALDMWQGDPIPVMNNLALNLASQEYLDEAASILEKAQSIAPDRIEVERNLRIVRTLQQSAAHAPKPTTKPQRDEVTQEPPAKEAKAATSAPVDTVEKAPVTN